MNNATTGTNTMKGFTEAYFLEECVRFRQSLGDATWWAKTEEQQQNYMSGLSMVYLNIENEDGSRPSREQFERWGKTFHDTLTEYERRKTFMMINPPPDKPCCPICKRPNGVTNKVDGIYRCYMVNHPAPIVCEEVTV